MKWENIQYIKWEYLCPHFLWIAIPPAMMRKFFLHFGQWQMTLQHSILHTEAPTLQSHNHNKVWWIVGNYKTKYQIHFSASVYKPIKQVSFLQNLAFILSYISQHSFEAKTI